MAHSKYCYWNSTKVCANGNNGHFQIILKATYVHSSTGWQAGRLADENII